MKPVLFLTASALIFLLVLSGAFIWDSSRLLQSAYDEVAAIDRELALQDERIRGIVDDGTMRAADERAGALNRRAIVLRKRDEVSARYNAFAQGLRGRIARKATGLPEAL